MLFILSLRETTKNTYKLRGITMELDVRKYQLNSRKQEGKTQKSIQHI